jgi:hypothetical protein
MRSGINVFPSVVLVENGSATAAYALPSLRQLRDILDQREPQARKETTQ